MKTMIDELRVLFNFDDDGTIYIFPDETTFTYNSVGEFQKHYNSNTNSYTFIYIIELTKDNENDQSLIEHDTTFRPARPDDNPSNVCETLFIIVNNKETGAKKTVKTDKKIHYGGGLTPDN